MICPSCRMFVTGSDDMLCPRCGSPLDMQSKPGPASYGSSVEGTQNVPGEPPRSRLPSSGGFSGAPAISGAWKEEGAAYDAPARWPSPPSEAFTTDINLSGPPPGSGFPPPSFEAPVVKPPKPKRKKSKKKSLLTTLGIIAGVLTVCAILVVVEGTLGRAVVNEIARKTPTPFAGTTPGQTILFQDPLTSNVNGWSDDGKTCFFLNGSYHIRGAFICYAPAGIISDAAISVQVQQLSGLSTIFYGLRFRRTDPKDAYEFEIDSNSKWRFVKIVNGNFSNIVPYQENAAIHGGLNTTNYLLVHAKGSHFEFFVNGTKVGAADDTTFSQGKTGLLSNDGVEVAYNNFQMTNP